MSGVDALETVDVGGGIDTGSAGVEHPAKGGAVPAVVSASSAVPPTPGGLVLPSVENVSGETVSVVVPRRLQLLAASRARTEIT